MITDKDRVILHCDCNSFFASVETVLNPELKKYPVAVCGSEEDRHGIVLAKNEIAKRYGIQTAETVHSARKKCPELVVVNPHYKEYAEFSRRINNIYKEYTDLVEPFGIDESWLDVTASRKLFGDGLEIAEKIRKRIKSEIGLTVSIGVSFNKVFAKLGSDYKKPDAITEINRENYTRIVYPLPVSDLLFVGKKTARELYAIGIKTIGDLAEVDMDILVKHFGKIGVMLFEYSRGLDTSLVVSSDNQPTSKSISNGLTFKYDLTRKEEWRVGINYLCEEIGYKLRSQGIKCTTVGITIKDSYLKSIQRQRAVDPPSDIGEEISLVAFELLCNVWQEGKPIRMLTVAATGFVESSANAQLNIFDFDDSTSRKKALDKEKAVDKLRQKYGSSSIKRASFIDTSIADLAENEDE